jgi:hypothetical protein
MKFEVRPFMANDREGGAARESNIRLSPKLLARGPRPPKALKQLSVAQARITGEVFKLPKKSATRVWA